MTDQTANFTHAAKAASPGTSLIGQVARKSGVSPFRQFADMFRLKAARPG